MAAYPALVVVADEHSARFFVRASPRAAMIEKTAYAESADLLEHGEHLSSGIMRSGGRSRTKPRTLRSKEELEVFMRRVAALTDQAVATEKPVRLAIIAPPAVMNDLRDFMTATTRAHIAYETCEPMANQSLAEIDAAMRLATL